MKSGATEATGLRGIGVRVRFRGGGEDCVGVGVGGEGRDRSVGGGGRGGGASASRFTGKGVDVGGGGKGVGIAVHWKGRRSWRRRRQPAVFVLPRNGTKNGEREDESTDRRGEQRRESVRVVGPSRARENFEPLAPSPTWSHVSDSEWSYPPPTWRVRPTQYFLHLFPWTSHVLNQLNSC